MKILIADSGATKADWYLVENGEILHFFSSKGISPVFQSQQEIAEELRESVIQEFIKWEIEVIYFYGSGCTAENIPTVWNALNQSFVTDNIKVYSDIIAVAHSLCGNKAGIACILGTGSNSCEWNGKAIVKQISPLGFILGDEGSGAYMGKKLLGDALKNRLSERIKEKLLKEYELTPGKIIDKVYREPYPSRFLASFSPFIKENILDDSIRSIVKESFNQFFERNVMQYNYNKYNVNFAGSIAWHYSELLHETAKSKAINIGKIIKSPIDGLIEYYKSEKNHFSI